MKLLILIPFVLCFIMSSCLRLLLLTVFQVTDILTMMEIPDPLVLRTDFYYFGPDEVLTYYVMSSLYVLNNDQNGKAKPGPDDGTFTVGVYDENQNLIGEIHHLNWSDWIASQPDSAKSWLVAGGPLENIHMKSGKRYTIVLTLTYLSEERTVTVPIEESTS